MLASAGLGRYWLWFALLIPILAACNLNASDDAGGQSLTISGPPVVRLAAPPSNATFLEGVVVNIQATISNAGPDINRIDLAIDGAITESVQSPNPTGAAVFSLTRTWTALGVGPHTISATAFRSDGSSSAPASVSITVVGQSQGPLETPPTDGQAGGSPQPDVQPTSAPQPLPQATDTPADPTATPPPTATPTPSRPQARTLNGVNVRRGPSTLFEPPIGSFAADTTTDALGVSPDGSWYKVRYFNGEGWIFAQLLEITGDTSAIPVDAGPPLPTLTPTPVPFTPTPVTSANLLLTRVNISPFPLRCGSTATITVDVHNNGSGPTSSTASILVEDVHSASGGVQQTTNGPIPVLGAGETSTAQMFLTVSTFFAEEHRLTITVDSNGQVPELNEGDNQDVRTYVLDRASC